jgi:hypothetical protein
MRTIWKLIILSFLSIGFLTGCNTAEKRDSLNQENDVNFRPVRNDGNPNENESNNDYKNQDNRRFLQDETP